MINRIGYACINTSIDSNFKDCRLASVYKNGSSFLREIILHNIKLTKDTLIWNINNNILMYRVTSKLIPFATHEDVLKSIHYNWYEDVDILNGLNDIKKIVIENNIRLSMHPDQFTVLNSNRNDVIEKAIINLEYHKFLLEKLGGTDLIIHTGGVYGNKADAMRRFIKTYNTLSHDIRQYLRLENDDISYTLSDVISISKCCGIPIVLDIHHYNCNNTENEKLNDLIYDVNKSWILSGIIPKCHISSGIDSYKDRRHADYISPSDFFSFCDITNEITVDLMVEAKSKELAVLNLKKLINI